MKKTICFCVILLIMLTFLPGASFAQPLQLVYDGAVHQYAGAVLALKVNGELVATDVPPVIINDRTLVPARAVFEKVGAEVGWDAASQKVSLSAGSILMELKINDTNVKVNEKTVQLDVPAKIINDRTMLPLRFIGEQLGMKVDWLPNEGVVTLDQVAAAPADGLKDIKCEQKEGVDVVTITLDGVKSYNAFRLTAPDRIVIDIANAAAPAKQQKIDVNSTYVKTVRYAQFNDSTARIVLDVDGQPEYLVDNKSGQMVVNIGTAQRNSDPQSRGDADRDNTPSVPARDFNVKHIQAEGEDQVIISTADFKGYNLMRLSDPERIIIDIPGFNQPFTEQRLDVNSGRIKSVRYAKFNASTLRTVIDTTASMQYRAEEKDGKLVLHVTNAGYKNMEYHNNQDSVYFALPKIRLTSGDKGETKLYKESYDPSGKKYTLTIPMSAAEFGTSGIMNINDNLMDSVSFIPNQTSRETSITFYSKKEVTYEITQKTEADNTVSTVIKPVVKGPDIYNKLVVIDPGHGGSESGAVYGDLLEKNLNMDIAKRLNTLLKGKNIKTYMIREDDSYVGLYERSDMANQMNAALFLSIHNNANDKRSRGTETLYRPSDPEDGRFTSKRFSQIIQEKLIAALGTINRGTVPRPNLVVLRETKMPAALAEIAFLDNQEDRALLLQEDFRQKAAQALCDAVIQALGELK